MCADVSSAKQDYILYGVKQIFSTLLFMSSPYYVDPQTSFNSFSFEKVDRERYTEFRVGADAHTGANCAVSSDARAELIVDKLVSLVGPPSDTLVGSEAAEDIADQIASISEDGQEDVRIGPEPVSLPTEDVLIVDDVDEPGDHDNFCAESDARAWGDKFIDEACEIHRLVRLLGEAKDALDAPNFCEDKHRALLAQSAAMFGKSKKLASLAWESNLKEFYSSADAFIDFRGDLRTKINVAIQEFGNAEAVSGMTSSVLPADALDKSKLISLSQRLGVRQSTRQSRPTMKTKQ